MHEHLERYKTEHAHFIIDGQPYLTKRQIFTIAQSRGWNGTYAALAARLDRGACTWEELLVPLDKTVSAASKKAHQRKRDEMAEVIAQLDARKNQ